MIDFYYSCKGYLIYDLAVVVNDWCSDQNGNIIPEKYKKLMMEYSNVRNLSDSEKDPELKK